MRRDVDETLESKIPLSEAEDELRREVVMLNVERLGADIKEGRNEFETMMAGASIFNSIELKADCSILLDRTSRAQG